MRKFLGLLLFALGFSVLVADFHVAYLKQGAAHALNVFAGIAILFAGLLAVMPMLAKEIADEMEKRVPKVVGMWPGGARKTDPPPDPNVPPPPRVP